jgi:hypothetical protein
MTYTASARTARDQDEGVLAACASCGAPLQGQFCAHCGEQVIDRRALTLWHFASHGLLHEVTHLDGKIFQTLRYLLFRPGFLSEEYFAGRRRPYINPVRLLLTIVVVFALVGHGTYASMTIGKLRLSLLPPAPPSSGTIADTAKQLDVLGALTGLVERTGATKDLQSDAAAEKFHHELKTYATALSFSNVVLLAGLLFLMFHTRRRFFVEHLVFSLHLASFVLLFSVFASWMFWLIGLPGTQNAAQITAAFLLLLVPVAQIVYLHQALLRFYYSDRDRPVKWWSGAAWLTKLAVLAVFLANSLFISVVYTTGAAIALARL